jgi:hypothetical protein
VDDERKHATVSPQTIETRIAVPTPGILTVHEFYEKNRKWQAVQIAFLVASTASGFIWSGLPGAAVGVGLSCVSYFLVPQGLTKVREIRR